MKIFAAGQLIKVHARTKAGGRVTDPADLPAEKTDYAMRDIASQQAKANRRGAAIGAFVATVLDGPLP